MKKILLLSLLIFSQISYAQIDFGVDVKKEEPKTPVYDGLSNIHSNYHDFSIDDKHLHNEEVVYIGISEKTKFYKIIANEVNYSQPVEA